MIAGFDVSHYQGAIDWPFLRRMCPWLAFVGIGEMDGVTFADPLFPDNWSRAGAQGLIRLAYDFAEPFAGSGEAEASFMLSHVSDRRSAIPVLDMESEPSSDDTSDLLAYVLDWGRIVRPVWTQPVLYSREDYMRRHNLLGRPELAGWGKWIASYQTKAFPSLSSGELIAFWQYGQGQLPGIGGAVDLDIFNGDQGALDRYASAA